MVIAILVPAVIAFLLGKVFCSWACPYNLLAEYADLLRKKWGKQKSVPKDNPSAKNCWILPSTLLLVAIITGIPIITLVSLPGLISAQMADIVLFGTLGIELTFVAILLLVEIFFAPRFWCKYACPQGAALGLFKSKKTLKIDYMSSRCKVQCSDDKKNFMCRAMCPLHLNPRQEGLYPFCYNCSACVEICNNTGGKAINFTLKTEN